MARLKKASSQVNGEIRRSLGATRVPIGDLVVPGDGFSLDGIDATVPEIIAYYRWQQRQASSRIAQMEAAAAAGLAIQMNMHEANGEISWMHSILDDLKKSAAEGRPPAPSTLSAFQRITRFMSDSIGFYGRLQSETNHGGLIKGSQAMEFLRDLYRRHVTSGRLSIESTSAFDAAELPVSKPLIVLTNLARNSFYWGDRHVEKGKPVILRLDAYDVTLPPIDPEGNEDWERESRPRTIITFEDNGPGIPPDQQDSIFDPFVSGRGSTGIGLHLCRLLLERSGNTMIVGDSPDLGGARFTFGSSEYLQKTDRPAIDPRISLLAFAWSMASLIADGDSGPLSRAQEDYADLTKEHLRIRISGPQDAIDLQLAAAAGALEDLLAGRACREDVCWPAEYGNAFPGIHP